MSKDSQKRPKQAKLFNLNIFRFINKTFYLIFWEYIFCFWHLILQFESKYFSILSYQNKHFNTKNINYCCLKYLSIYCTIEFMIIILIARTFQFFSFLCHQKLLWKDHKNIERKYRFTLMKLAGKTKLYVQQFLCH